MRILKYPMDANGEIRIPAGSRPLHFAFQGVVPTMWAMMSFSFTGEDAYEILPTGARVSPDAEHIGTAVHPELALVFHCFKIDEKARAK